MNEREKERKKDKSNQINASNAMRCCCLCSVQFRTAPTAMERQDRTGQDMMEWDDSSLVSSV